MEPSITSWARLEPRTRSADMDAGLAARIADPAWLLARQWQVGEFLGEDAGSPVSARVRLDVAPFTSYRPAGGSVGSYDPSIPLEVVVERESRDDALDRRHAAETGQQFLRLLAAHRVGEIGSAYTAAMPFTVSNGPNRDVANDRRLAIYANRVPDGARLAAAFGPSPVTDLPAIPSLTAAQRPGVLAAADEWVRGYAASVSSAADTSSAWLANRMEYAFDIGAHDTVGEIVLTAGEYHGGRLDWVDLDLAAGTSLGTSPSSRSSVHTLMPTPVTYAGMPSPRWWEYEQGRINFGALEAEATDLARMMLIEFATAYGNDHFVIPVEMPVGATARVTSLVITNTFGEQVLVPAANDPGWSMFELSRIDGSRSMPVLALMPTVIDSVDSAPLEEVLLARDEMANLSWAIEHQVAGAAGLAVDRQQALETHAPAASLPQDAGLRYTLATAVPDNWIPLIPAEASGQMRLVLQHQQRVEDGELVEIPPVGKLLAADGLWLFPEEVPATGARITRGWQVTRAPDGTSHLWMARAKGPGRGSGSSDLRFDTTDN